jgi:hypothetical protein
MSTGATNMTTADGSVRPTKASSADCCVDARCMASTPRAMRISAAPTDTMPRDCPATDGGLAKIASLDPGDQPEQNPQREQAQEDAAHVTGEHDAHYVVRRA